MELTADGAASMFTDLDNDADSGKHNFYFVLFTVVAELLMLVIVLIQYSYDKNLKVIKKIFLQAR